jgi:hypothetical protein
VLNYKAAIQAVDYIVKNGSCEGILNKLAILKLLFFAERYSLRKYAQSITGDQFWAMRLGPVASETYNMISFKDTVSAEHLKYTQEILSKDGLYGVKSNGALIMRDDYDELSDTDIEALDFSIKEFGQYSSSKLVDITHLYKEWNRFEEKLKDEKSSFKINIEDFFEKTNEQTKEYSIIADDQVELNKEFYLGNPFDR